MPPIARASAALLLAASLACALAPSGCSNQGEGERCSTQNGNDDCQDGLACLAVSGKQENFERCCPPDPTQVTTSECTPTPNLPTGDAGSPDTSVVDSAGQDTSVQDTSVQDTSVQDTSVVDSSKPTDAATEGG